MALDRPHVRAEARRGSRRGSRTPCRRRARGPRARSSSSSAHPRDDERLGDRLAAADAERGVLVGVRARGRRARTPRAGRRRSRRARARPRRSGEARPRGGSASLIGSPRERRAAAPRPGRLPPAGRADPRRLLLRRVLQPTRRTLLEAEGHHPRVLMQVFQRKESILGGIDEAIAVLKQCAGRRGADGAWVDGWDAARGPRAARGRRDRAVGDRDDDRGRLLAVRPPRDRLPRLPGAPHAGHAQRARGRRGGRAASRSCSSPPATTTGSCRPATAGRRTSPGAIGVSTDAQASWWGGRGVGTVPHGLIAAYGGDTVAAARAFADRFGARHERHRARRLRQRLGARPRSRSPRRSATTCGACGWTPPTGSPTARCRRRHGDEAPTGVAPRAGRAGARRARRRAASSDVQIVVSGGFTAERDPRVRGGRRAGRRLRRRLVADPRRPTTSPPTSCWSTAAPCAKVGAREAQPAPQPRGMSLRGEGVRCAS